MNKIKSEVIVRAKKPTERKKEKITLVFYLDQIISATQQVNFPVE